MGMGVCQKYHESQRNPFRFRMCQNHGETVNSNVRAIINSKETMKKLTEIVCCRTTSQAVSPLV